MADPWVAASHGLTHTYADVWGPQAAWRTDAWYTEALIDTSPEPESHARLRGIVAALSAPDLKAVGAHLLQFQPRALWYRHAVQHISTGRQADLAGADGMAHDPREYMGCVACLTDTFQAFLDPTRGELTPEVVSTARHRVMNLALDMLDAILVAPRSRNPALLRAHGAGATRSIMQNDPVVPLCMWLHGLLVGFPEVATQSVLGGSSRSVLPRSKFSLEQAATVLGEAVVSTGFWPLYAYAGAASVAAGAATGAAAGSAAAGNRTPYVVQPPSDASTPTDAAFTVALLAHSAVRFETLRLQGGPSKNDVTPGMVLNALEPALGRPAVSSRAPLDPEAKHRMAWLVYCVRHGLMASAVWGSLYAPPRQGPRWRQAAYATAQAQSAARQADATHVSDNDLVWSAATLQGASDMFGRVWQTAERPVRRYVLQSFVRNTERLANHVLDGAAWDERVATAAAHAAQWAAGLSRRLYVATAGDAAAAKGAGGAVVPDVLQSAQTPDVGPAVDMLHVVASYLKDTESESWNAAAQILQLFTVWGRRAGTARPDAFLLRDCDLRYYAPVLDRRIERFSFAQQQMYRSRPSSEAQRPEERETEDRTAAPDAATAQVPHEIEWIEKLLAEKRAEWARLRARLPLAPAAAGARGAHVAQDERERELSSVRAAAVVHTMDLAQSVRAACEKAVRAASRRARSAEADATASHASARAAEATAHRLTQHARQQGGAADPGVAAALALARAERAEARAAAERAAFVAQAARLQQVDTARRAAEAASEAFQRAAAAAKTETRAALDAARAARVELGRTKAQLARVQAQLDRAGHVGRVGGGAASASSSLKRSRTGPSGAPVDRRKARSTAPSTATAPLPASAAASASATTLATAGNGASNVINLVDTSSSDSDSDIDPRLNLLGPRHAARKD